MVLLALALGQLRAYAQSGSCSFLSPPDPSLDLPDDQYLDANGDGIDGMRCGPIFVSPDGSDANLGTVDSPMGTIGAAILAARSYSPSRDVYIAAGTYEGTVVLAAGVDLYGGYSAGWARSLGSRATIHIGPGGGDAAMLAVNIAQPTLVDHLIIASDRDPTSQTPGADNVAALVLSYFIGSITFNHCDFTPSGGTAGADGLDGTPGVNGSEGHDGEFCGGEGGEGSNPGGNGGQGCGPPLPWLWLFWWFF